MSCPNDSCCQVYCWVWSSRAGAENLKGGAPPPLNWVVASFCAVHRPVKQHGKRAQKHWWTTYIKCMNHHTTTRTEPSQVQASPGPCAESGGPVCCGQPTAAGRQGLSVHCTLLLPDSMGCIVPTPSPCGIVLSCCLPLHSMRQLHSCAILCWGQDS